MKLAFTMMLMFFATTLAAQNRLAEVFIGYSMDKQQHDPLVHGWNGSFAVNVSPEFAIVADVSRHGLTNWMDFDIRTHASIMALRFGPRVQFHSGPVSPFAQFLMGGARLSASGTIGGMGTTQIEASDHINGPALAIGGGFDFNLSPDVALRALQLEYNLFRFGRMTSKGARAGFGIVIRFGGDS